MVRREFLGAWLAAPLLAAHRIDRSRFSALTDEVGTTQPEALAFVKQYGLRWVELRGIPGTKISYVERPPAELRELARQLAGEGLRVSHLDAALLKFPLPGTIPLGARKDGAKPFARRMEDLRRAMDAARTLGADKIRIFAFSRVAEPEKVWPRVAEIFAQMGEAAGRERMHLLIENEASCNVATTVELGKFLKLVPSKWVRINWDPHNGLPFEKRPFPDGYALLPKKRIANVHIKARSLMGPTTFDWKAIFAALARDGYRGCIGLETHVRERLVESAHASIREMIRIVEG